MTTTSASMDAVQGWLPFTPADAEAIETGRYILDSEYLTVDGIYYDPVRPYEIKGRWCTRAQAGSTAATHVQGSTLVRYYPDAPPGTPPPEPALTPIGGIVTFAGTAAEAAALAPTWAVCDGVANSPGPDLSCDYAPVILAHSPIGYWRLGEASGTSATDSSGNGRTGTYGGGVAKPTLGEDSLVPADPNNKAAAWDGATSYSDVQINALAATFDGTAPWSFETWIEQTPDGTFRYIFSATSADPYTSAALTSANAGIVLSRQDGAGHDDCIGAALSAGRHHLACTYDGAALRMYVDGTLHAGPTASTRSAAANTKASIGNYAVNQAVPFLGTIDEVALYDYALGASLVIVHHATGMAPCLIPLQRME